MSEVYALMPKISCTVEESPSVSDVRQTLIEECVCDALLYTVILDNLDDPVWLAALTDILETERAGSGTCPVRT